MKKNVSNEQNNKLNGIKGICHMHNKFDYLKGIKSQINPKKKVNPFVTMLIDSDDVPFFNKNYNMKEIHDDGELAIIQGNVNNMRLQDNSFQGFEGILDYDDNGSNNILKKESKQIMSHYKGFLENGVHKINADILALEDKIKIKKSLIKTLKKINKL